jgi:hypothetical protein
MTVSIALMVFGFATTGYGLYMLGVERGRQLREDEGGAHS